MKRLCLILTALITSVYSIFGYTILEDFNDFLIDENQQITALAYVATLKNLVAIIFQNVAGNILDVTTYSNLYLICFGWMLVALILVIFFKISSGNDKKLFN